MVSLASPAGVGAFTMLGESHTCCSTEVVGYIFMDHVMALGECVFPQSLGEEGICLSLSHFTE